MAEPDFLASLRLPRPIRAFLDYGLDGLTGRRLRQKRALNLLSLLVVQSGLAYAALYLIYDWRGLWPVAAVVSLFALFALVPMISRRRETGGMMVAVGLTIVLQLTLTWMLGTGSGLHLFLFSVPAIGIVCFGTDHLRLMALIGMVCALAMILAGLYFTSPAPFITVDDTLLALLRSSVFLVVTAFVLFGVWLGFAIANSAEDALEVAFDRSESLLYNLLPTGIATRLKGKPDGTIADTLPKVAILFADIVGFTPRSARMEPRELVEFLNCVFSAFDGLAREHGLEKIKTIGDAYMVAAGLPEPCGDPVQRAAAMAVDMLGVADRLSSQTGEEIELRIGLHAGPAVAGVIGSQKLF